MTCNDKCIHFPVCEQKKYDFANIDECLYYEEARPHGEWIEHRKWLTKLSFYSEYECSNCHDDWWQKIEWQYCPICGSDNRPKEGDEK